MGAIYKNTTPLSLVHEHNFWYETTIKYIGSSLFFLEIRHHDVWWAGFLPRYSVAHIPKKTSKRSYREKKGVHMVEYT